MRRVRWAVLPDGMERYPVFFTVPLLYKAGFLFQAVLVMHVCHSTVSFLFSSSLWAAAHCCWSVYKGAGLAWWQVVTDLTQWKELQWTRLVKIAPKKANGDINEPTVVLLWTPWRLRTHRHQCVCIGVSCQAKWHESCTSEDHRDGEFKEIGVLTKKTRCISTVYLLHHH